jgi:hypothetical protein
MFCMSIIQRRYVLRMLVAAVFSLLFSAMAAAAIRAGHAHASLAYLFAILPAFPIMGALVVTGLYLAEETDDFQRHVMVQSLLGGIAITLSATTVYGYLEALAHVPHIQMTWVYPIFWIATSVSVPLVWMRYR